MTTQRDRLANLRAVLGPEAAELAKRFMPTPEHETEAERMIREREQTDRTQRVLAMRETRDELLAGKYGKEAKAKATEFAVTHGKDTEKTLEYCARLAAKVRTGEYYKRRNTEQKTKGIV